MIDISAGLSLYRLMAGELLCPPGGSIARDCVPHKEFGNDISAVIMIQQQCRSCKGGRVREQKCAVKHASEALVGRAHAASFPPTAVDSPADVPKP